MKSKVQNNICQKIIREIKTNHSFLICTHIDPEGDAIGSILSLALALEKLGKRVYVYSEDPIPLTINFLPGAEKIKLKFKNPRAFDVVFVLDCGELKRIGSQGSYLTGYEKIINIDHHSTNEKFGFLNLVDSRASSTGEILYELFKEMRVNISQEMAENLYCAMATDTGFFRYPNTQAKTLKVAGELVSLGVDPGLIAERVYASYPLPRLKLLSRVLNSLALTLNKQVAYIVMLQKDIEESRASQDLAENFIDYPKSIAGVRMAIFFKEKDEGRFRVSFRSKGSIDVAKICEFFSGGGHKAAAACEVKGALAEVKRKVFAQVKKALN